jgi:hypothetical protein
LFSSASASAGSASSPAAATHQIAVRDRIVLHLDCRVQDVCENTRKAPLEVSNPRASNGYRGNFPREIRAASPRLCRGYSAWEAQRWFNSRQRRELPINFQLVTPSRSSSRTSRKKPA